MYKVQENAWIGQVMPGVTTPFFTPSASESLSVGETRKLRIVRDENLNDSDLFSFYYTNSSGNYVKLGDLNLLDGEVIIRLRVVNLSGTSPNVIAHFDNLSVWSEDIICPSSSSSSSTSSA
jgi:hypothetical protein